MPSSVPTDRLLVEINVDLLGFQIFFDTPGTEFAAKARLLVTAPRSFYISWLHMIHPDDACAQSFNRSQGFENVASPDRGGEAVRRIVGDLQRIFFVFKRNHGRNGAKNFFAGNAGGVRDVGENGGLDVVAFAHLLGASSARGERRLLLADFDVGVHAVVLFFADQRAHLGFPVERRTELDLLGLLRHRFDKVLVDRLLYQDAASGGTDFALVNEDAEECAIDGRFEVSVGKEDVGRFAAELEGDALYRVSGLLDDDLANRGAAGEGDLVDVSMLDERGAAGFSETGNDVDHAGRQTAVREIIRQFERGKRRLLGGLEDAGAARSDCRREFPRGHQQGIIPGNNLAGDANRLLERKRHCSVWSRIHVAEGCGGEAAVVLEAGGGIVDIEFGFNDGLTGVAAFEFGEGGKMGPDLFCQTEQDAAAFLRG